MTAVAAPQDHYAAAFAERRQDGNAPAWLARLRTDAFARFGRLGFPTTRDEDWRFTSVSPIAETPFRPAPASTVDPVALDRFAIPGLDTVRLVFVNGRWAPELSSPDGLPKGVLVAGLATVLNAEPGLLESRLGLVVPDERRAFPALNTALTADGAVVVVPAGTAVERPIHLLFLTVPGREPVVTHPRVLIDAGAHSQVQVIEQYAATGDGRYLTNTVAEVRVDANAVVDHYRLQDESVHAFHVGTLYVRCARDARFASHSISIGGGLVRQDALAVLDGEGIDCTLNGVYLADGDRLVDNHTTIDHAKPHCDSHEVYKGILGGRARAVFNGKIVVRPDAQKTNAKQTNKALLLSDDAQINSKPQLEIFADDVKCTHGAAIGQLDDDALFYLRARGLTARDARDLLIRAYAGDVLDRFRLDPLRSAVERRVLAALPADSTGGAV